MAQEQFAPYNVVASYPDMDAAREVMRAIELRGIDASHVSLLGPAPEKAAAETDTTDRDSAVTGEVTKGTLIGGAAGTAAGGLAGFLAGLAAFGIPGVGPVLGMGIWTATVGGATLGGGIGASVGAVSALSGSDAWELTYEVKEGRALVGVHSDDPKEIDRAAEVLEDHRPVQMKRFDREGRLLRSP